MNEFRQALDAHLAGRLELPQVERELLQGLSRAPQMAAAQSAYVEALYRVGRLQGEAYLKLIQAIRTFQQSVPREAGGGAAPAPPPTLAPGAPPAAADDKTQFRAPAAPKPAAGSSQAEHDPSADRTQFRAPRAPAARPAVLPADVSAPSGAPGAGTAGSDSGPGPATGGPSTGTSTGTGSRSTGASWSDPSRWSGDGESLGPGSVVKDRFFLEEELGRGGMGIVFKARDHRKEEAQDRNPFVALKILNEEFKRHPESLKALQRESRKAQRLAHPNVVTVYDFDRDGANVFMVMELLEGESLERLIRNSEGAGVGKELALRLTRDLCRAMAYAHEQGVVHSDFKPANAFLTREGNVKVFDFGIARAAKRADNVAGSTTLFDPGTLGALTPTYASCEMIEGLEPDPRDDVYAIACVAYELLTGKHPFNRLSAVQARDKGMVAKRPRGLPRRQWRAIQHGLAFNRAERSVSALQLLNELIPPKRRSALPVAIAATIAIGVVLAWTFVPTYLAKRRERLLIQTLQSRDPGQLGAVRAQLQALTPQQRAALLLDENARAGLIRFFEARIDAAIDPSRSTVDYPTARALLDELNGFLPDSLAVRDLQDRLLARENDEIKRQSDLFDSYLQRGLLIDAQGGQNVGTALAAIQRIDANNRLLRDPRLPGAFAEQARKALQAGNTVLAQSLVAAGLAFDPTDATLADLKDQAQSAAQAGQLAARRKVLEGSLATALGAHATLADLDAHRADIDELRSIAADSATLVRAQDLARREIGQQLAQLEKQGQPAQAQELVAKYADILPGTFVDQQRQELASASGALQQKQAAVQQVEGAIDALLRDQKMDSSWDSAFAHQLRLLSAYVPATDPYVVQVKTRAAQGYLAQARTLRGAERLTEADRMLQQARTYAPGSADLVTEGKLLAQARTSQESAATERNRQAQLEALKQKLLVQAGANDVAEALASIKELRANLPANDGYLVIQAPTAIASAYLRLASIAAKDGRFDNAVSLTSKAREIAPSLKDLDSASQRYTRYQALDQALKTSATLDEAAVRGELEGLARFDPVETEAVKQRLARDLVTRIRATTDSAEAARLTTLAQHIFRDDPALKSLADKSAPPTAAATTVQPQATPAPQAEATPAPGQTAAAASGSATAPGNASGRLASSAAAARAVPSQTGPGAVAETQLAPRVPPEIPCATKLAGYGKRRQAVCYDTFDGAGRGPDLVVIPAGPNITHPFAIGRTEISNADYATYCTRTGHCQPPAGSADAPLTGVSLSDAQRYLAWLSQVTGATYRLPTDAEWTYAAKAQGTGTETGSPNCVIEIGGKKVRGEALEPVQSGSANAWGLYNSLGNAQEWTVSGNAVAVRGGAYTDNVSQCVADASKPDSGAANEVTGLRAVRELE
jgi:serine/threonine protein kinase